MFSCTFPVRWGAFLSAALFSKTFPLRSFRFIVSLYGPSQQSPTICPGHTKLVGPAHRKGRALALPRSGVSLLPFSRLPRNPSAEGLRGRQEREQSLGLVTAGLKSLCDNLSLRVIPRSRRRRGISHCLENTQSEIPRSARNDSLARVFTQTLKPRPSPSW